MDHDVEKRLRGSRDIFRVGVGGQFARLNERRRNLDKGIESVANAADGRSGENSRRNNAQDRALEQINTTLRDITGKRNRI